MNKENETSDYDFIIASQAYRAASDVGIKASNVIKPLIDLLAKPGRLFITHSCGSDTVEKILKLAWKDKDPFPNKAQDLIDFLKNGNLEKGSKYYFSKPKKYNFKYKKTPDETISELFGYGVESKWANILYVGQVPEKDINEVEKKPIIIKKVKNAILKEDIFFNNEMFTIKKV